MRTDGFFASWASFDLFQLTEQFQPLFRWALLRLVLLGDLANLFEQGTKCKQNFLAPFVELFFVERFVNGERQFAAVEQRLVPCIVLVGLYLSDENVGEHVLI